MNIRFNKVSVINWLESIPMKWLARVLIDYISLLNRSKSMGKGGFENWISEFK